MNIGEIINRAMRIKKISQQEIADVAGISRPGVTKWISGKSIPTADKFVKVVTYLDLVEEFFPDYAKKVDDSDLDSMEEKIALLDARVKALESEKPQ